MEVILEPHLFRYLVRMLALGFAPREAYSYKRQHERTERKGDCVHANPALIVTSLCTVSVIGRCKPPTDDFFVSFPQFRYIFLFSAESCCYLFLSVNPFFYVGHVNTLSIWILYSNQILHL
jgi:hypothetical protein